jgi:GAF domain-containing protein
MELPLTPHGLRGLLRATWEVTRTVDLEQILRHVVAAGRELVDAGYGALGVVSRGRLVRFIHDGIPGHTATCTGDPPSGRGLLGRLVDDPRPLRLRNLADHPAAIGFPAGYPPMGSFLGVPIRVQDRVFANLYLTEKRGAEEFTADDETLILALAAAAGVAVQNAMQFAETRRRQAWQCASTEFATGLLGGEQPARLLQRVARVAVELSDGDGTAVLLPSDDPEQLRVAVAVGALFEEVEGTSLPMRGTLSGLAYAERRTVADLGGDPRSAVPDPAEASPAIAAPLGTGQTPRGVLLVSRRRGSEAFSATDQEMIGSFAGHAGLALELACNRLDQETDRLAADRERIAERLNADALSELLAISTGLHGLVARGADPTLATAVLQHADRVDRVARRIGASVFDLDHLRTNGRAST